MPTDSVGKRPQVERQLDGGRFEKTAVATKPKPNPLGLGAITAVRFRRYRVTRLEIIGEANTNNFLVGGETPTQKHLHHRWAEDCILASPQCPSNYGFYDK